MYRKKDRQAMRDFKRSEHFVEIKKLKVIIFGVLIKNRNVTINVNREGKRCYGLFIACCNRIFFGFAKVI